MGIDANKKDSSIDLNVVQLGNFMFRLAAAVNCQSKQKCEVM